jgi:hypothetical protein
MIELTIESLLILLEESAASKTNKTNTLARKVSMIGARFAGNFLKLEQGWGWKLILDNRRGGFSI